MSFVLQSLLLATFIVFIPLSFGFSLVAWLKDLVGFGSVTLTSGSQTILLDKTSSNIKHASDHSGTRTISLRGLVEQITIPLRLNPLLFNGHAQTMAVAAGFVGPDCQIHFKRKNWISDNKIYPGEFAVDFVVPSPPEPFIRKKELPPRTGYFGQEEWITFVKKDTDRPLVIVLHGFLGGSHEKYIRHSLDLLTSGGKDANFSVAVINSRGCSYSKLTSPIMYHPQATWDIRQLVAWARDQWPHRRLFAIAFSIGANVLCNYLGEEGEKCELEAAVLVGNPWNLDITNTLMANSFLGLHVYQCAHGTAFRKAVEGKMVQSILAF